MSTALLGQPASNGSGARGWPPADGGGTRLRLYRNPLRLAVSPSLWRAAWFLAVYVFAVGWVLFAVVLTATVTAAVLLITLAGIPLLVAAAAVLRWCAGVERGPAAAGARRAGQGQVPAGGRAACWPRPGGAGRTRPPGAMSPTWSGSGRRSSSWTRSCSACG